MDSLPQQREKPTVEGREMDDEFISHATAVILKLAEYQNHSPEQLNQGKGWKGR